MPDVTVILPTFQRPNDLERAVRSVFAQTGIEPFEILLIDNDPSASARAVSELLQQDSPSHISLRYIHEPAAGVANARNTAIANTNTKLVAFLDDDQSVPSGWLAQLVEFHKQHPTPVTFGPVVTELPEATTHHRSYLESFFARAPQLPSGLIDQYYGCGNSLLDLSLIELNRPLFDIEMNETGGEDDLLFRSIKDQGHRFGWCAEAHVYEHVPPTRAQLGYTLKRAFAYGQGPVTLARKASPRQNGKIFFWMIIGAGKAALNTTMYAASWIVRSPSRATYLDRAIRGAGKVLWWVDLRFYGESALNKAPAK